MMTVQRARSHDGAALWWIHSDSKQDLEAFSRDFLNGSPVTWDALNEKWEVILRGRWEKVKAR